MFDNFFLNGAIPPNAAHGTYNYFMLLASYLVASLGSYAGLTLAVQLYSATAKHRKLFLHAMGALALGGGIWSMHFIGMLAYKMPMNMHYDPWLTALSLLIAVISASIALQVIQVVRLSFRRIVSSAVPLGFGISAMHYTGMAAIRMEGSYSYIPSLFILSILIGIVASGAALWIAFMLGKYQDSRGKIAWRLLAAMVMGIAICGMHYTGAAAAVFIPSADCCSNIVTNHDFMAAAIIAVSMLLLTILAFTVSWRLFVIVGFGLISLLPLTAIVYRTITTLNEEIYSAQKEQMGIQYDKDMMELFLRTQELQGLTYIIRSDSKLNADILRTQKDLTRRALIKAAEAAKMFGNALDINQKWKDVRGQVLALLAPPESPRTPNQEFSDYSYTLISIADTLNLASDNSGLTVDPKLGSGFLAEAMTGIIPRAIQTAGALRNIAVKLNSPQAAPDASQSEDMKMIPELYVQLSFEDDKLINVLGRAARIDSQFNDFVDYHNTVVRPRLDNFNAQISSLVYGKFENGNLVGLFYLISDIAKPYEILYEDITTALAKEIQARQEKREFEKALTLYISVAAFLSYFVLLIFLHRGREKVAVQLDEMKHLKNSMQDYTDRLELSRTDLIITSKKLEEEKIKSDIANRAKSEFLANMSHELRTPLNGIMGMNRLMRKTGLSGEQRELVEAVNDSSNHLLKIVNDILDLSKIEAGEMKLENIGFDPQYVLKGVIYALERIAKERGLLLHCHYAQETFPYFLGDPIRFSRILMNLVGNAIKYTDRGQIDVYASCRDLNSKYAQFYCEVVDTGIGIPADRMKSIFEKFVQADVSTTRKYGGTGLGLTITKQLVELMGGTIGVESTLAVGTCFWFSIPFEVTDKLHEETAVRERTGVSGTIPPGDARVLIAEDQPMNELLVRKFLQEFKIGHFEVAKNGLEALQLYKDKPWDIVLMDCHMPGMNGYDTAREIRKIEETTGLHVPIVAMTADVMSDNREECIRHGMDEFISKPIHIDTLRNILGAWICFAPAEDFSDRNAGGLETGGD